MLKLCGFAASNYYNKVKFALLEKGVPFEEELIWGSSDPRAAGKTPLGKIPYIEDGALVVSESQAIVEYLELAYPERPLLPRDPLAAAKVRELIMYTEIYLEWEARRLYPEAFFGGKVSTDVKELVAKRLEKAASALFQLANFKVFALGAELTLADCSLVMHLPVIGMATNAIYGRDLVGEPVIKDYLARLGERPNMQKIKADRKVNATLMAERARAAAAR